MTDKHPRLNPTRRTVLGTGLLVGLAACGSDQLSTMVVPSAGSAGVPSDASTAAESPPPGITSPTPAESAPPLPAIQRFMVREIFPDVGGIALGARAAIFFRDDKAMLMSTALEGPQTLTIPEVTAQTPYGYGYAVETQLDSSPASSVLVLSLKSGSGLEKSQDILNCIYTDHADMTTVVTGEFVVPKPNGILQGAVMVSGVTVVTISWGEDWEDSETLLRVAFDPTGKVLWNRLEENKDRHPRGGVGRCTRQSDFITQPGAVLFGLGYSLLTVDITSGKTIATTKGPLGSGLDELGGSYFTLWATGGEGFDKGQVVFQQPKSTIIAKHVETVAIDPIQDTIAIGYHLKPEGDPNFPTALASDPAMVVRKTDGSELFRLPRDQGLPLGMVKCVAAFDGRLVVATKENLRILKAADGSAEPGYEDIAPGRFEARNLPLRGTPHAVLLGEGGSNGEAGWSGVLLSDTPLTWPDLSFEWLA